MRVRDVISKMQTPSIRIDFVYCGWGRRFMMRKRHQEKYYTAEMIMVGFHYKHIHFSIFDSCCWCWALPPPPFSRQTLPSYTYDRLIEIEMPIWIFINPPSLHSSQTVSRPLPNRMKNVCNFRRFFPQHESCIECALYILIHRHRFIVCIFQFLQNRCDINVVIKYTWSVQYLSLMAVIKCAFVSFWCRLPKLLR